MRFKWLIEELRSDHAGETGAVYIYKGAAAALQLRGSQSSDSSNFVSDHMTTEQLHLEYMEGILPAELRSTFLPIWRFSGWMLGWLPTVIGGDRWLFVTVDAVETFVDEHYLDQIKELRSSGWSEPSLENSNDRQDIVASRSSVPHLLALLEQCREDELHHRDDAREKHSQGISIPLLESAWARVIDAGSRMAVRLARWG